MASEASDTARHIIGYIESIHSIEKGARPLVKAYLGDYTLSAQHVDNVAEKVADHFSYQGWPNRETWCVALWLGNEAGHYEAARDICLGSGSVHEKAAKLADYVARLLEDASEKLAGRSGHGDRMAMDLATAATCRTDWRAIVAHFAEG